MIVSDLTTLNNLDLMIVSASDENITSNELRRKIRYLAGLEITDDPNFTALQIDEIIKIFNPNFKRSNSDTNNKLLPAYIPGWTKQQTVNGQPNHTNLKNICKCIENIRSVLSALPKPTSKTYTNKIEAMLFFEKILFEAIQKTPEFGSFVETKITNYKEGRISYIFRDPK